MHRISELLQTALTQHQAGHLKQAIDLYCQILQLQPGHADAMHLCGVAALQTGQCDIAAELITNAIRLNPSEPIFRYNLGNALLALNRPDAAADSYRQALRLKPDYAEAHNNLGHALHALGQLPDAIEQFNRAVAVRPDYTEAHHNLGILYGLTDQSGQAEACYRNALSIDPGYVTAHINLASLLYSAGRLDEAQIHRDLAYRRQNLFVESTPAAQRTVLIILDAIANIPLEHLIPARHNTLLRWVIEYATGEQLDHLPAFDVAFNALSDPDVTEAAARNMDRFLDKCRRPLLNPPAAIAKTLRHLLPELLAEIDGLVLPAAWRVEQTGNWHANPAFRFPVLVRPRASQGGKGLRKIDSREALAALAPHPDAIAYISIFHDFRSADGYYRKYRVIFVDRVPYPYHLAISEQWMVHYVTANMRAVPWKLEEEKRFLENPPSVLGAQGMSALNAIAHRLDLDYAGIDFSMLPDGRLLVFETNAAMQIHLEEEAALVFKNPHVQRIFDAFGVLLGKASSRPEQGEQQSTG